MHKLECFEVVDSIINNDQPLHTPPLYEQTIMEPVDINDCSKLCLSVSSPGERYAMFIVVFQNTGVQQRIIIVFQNTGVQQRIQDCRLKHEFPAGIVKNEMVCMLNH
jgi:hypothetical protein